MARKLLLVAVVAARAAASNLDTLDRWATYMF